MASKEFVISEKPVTSKKGDALPKGIAYIWVLGFLYKGETFGVVPPLLKQTSKEAKFEEINDEEVKTAKEFAIVEEFINIDTLSPQDTQKKGTQGKDSGSKIAVGKEGVKK